jgi:hypothetical protein
LTIHDSSGWRFAWLHYCSIRPVPLSQRGRRWHAQSGNREYCKIMDTALLPSRIGNSGGPKDAAEAGGRCNRRIGVKRAMVRRKDEAKGLPMLKFREIS